MKAAYLKSAVISAIEALDNFCEACLNNHVAKRASIQQVGQHYRIEIISFSGGGAYLKMCRP